MPTDPSNPGFRDLIASAASRIADYDEQVRGRFVGPCPDPAELRAAIGDQLPDHGNNPADVVNDLAEAVQPGVVATSGGRYFGYVMGASLPASVAADMLSIGWDEAPGLYNVAPGSSMVEQIAGEWVLDLLDLPRESAVGFVTGCQMANVMGIASGIHAVLSRTGWNAAEQGLQSAPKVRVIAGAEAHGTIDRAVSMLGLGSANIQRIPADAHGRMTTGPLEQALADSDAPTIVCAQAGNVNTGAFDPMEPIGRLCNDAGAFLHLDGAFGLWARACKEKAHHAVGAQLADSWATDGHKWLNVPYDCGIVMVKNPANLFAATTYRGAYLMRDADTGRRDGCDYCPESSRRARATPVYAAIKQLGRSGVDDLVARCCSHARLFRDILTEAGGRVPHEVTINQCMVGFDPPEGRDPAEFNQALVWRIQQDGTCWLGGTTWQSTPLLRVSVSSWRTTEEDVRKSCKAILRCVEAERTLSV